MKKFLSLVLAMIMTMSLVTISAGATEYKDLTDKDEIQYEEAVAVLNRIGVITGYEDGSFRPEGELTRGAAAKIIVSLLIGPEAASNLPNTYAPYPDVPAGHTFAGVISFCKTEGIISGYGDGTFKPTNSLTGYAFAKMLLGAIGYDSTIQGYVDTGWTMNVARDGNAAGLFNRIEFDGAAAVNREEACQLALNTLKATMVEYTGGMNITSGGTTLTTMPTLTYKISNQSYATNISNRKASNIGNADVNNHYTVEFGEEHFKDLRLNDEHGTKYSTNANGNKIRDIARDDFGRPANKWSYKKVTIGTFPIEPDFIYTEQVIHIDDVKVTNAAKVRALGLDGYDLESDENLALADQYTRLWLNGVENYALKDTDGKLKLALDKVGDIADWTDNGTQVEVYVSEDDSDFIQDVVVVKTQLMEVKAVKSEAVSLKLYDDGSDNDKGAIGYNSKPLNVKVNDVEVNDECYSTLKDLKAGDIVAVIPVAPNHEDEAKYDVSRVYAPETVTGELTWVDTYGTDSANENGIAVTVGGTDYKIALWNKDLAGIDGTKIRVTRKDVKLFLDEFGNAMLATGVGSTSDYMVIGGYHSGLVDGIVVTYADGWDIKGNELSLNIGNARYDDIGGDGKTYAKYPIGSLVHYYSSTSSKYAEWVLDYQGVFNVASLRDGDNATAYELKASSSRVRLNDYMTAADVYNNSVNAKGMDNFTAKTDDTITSNVPVDDDGIKVIYLTMGDDDEVDTVEVKSGMQSISSDDILGTRSGFKTVARAQAAVSLKGDNDEVNANSAVKAIVVKLESGSADLSDLVYVSRYLGSAGKAAGADNTQRPVYGYEVHFVGQDGWEDEVTIYSYTRLDKGDFARSRKPVSFPEGVKNVTEDNFYTLTGYGTKDNTKIGKALSVLRKADIDVYNEYGIKTLVRLINNLDPAGANFTGQYPGAIDLDRGDQTAENLLSLRGAKIIDLTKHEIQSTSELKDELDDLAKDGLTLSVSVLYNDDIDSDGFRDVHVLVITGETVKKTTVKDQFDVTVTADDVVVKAEKVEDGKRANVSFTADAGKVIDTVTVNGAAQTVTEGQATFTYNEVVTGNVAIVITTKEGTPITGENADVTVTGGDIIVKDADTDEVVAESADGKVTLPTGKALKVEAKDTALVAQAYKGTIPFDCTGAFKAELVDEIKVFAAEPDTKLGKVYDVTGKQGIGLYYKPATTGYSMSGELVATMVKYASAAPAKGEYLVATLSDGTKVYLKGEWNGYSWLYNLAPNTDDEVEANFFEELNEGVSATYCTKAEYDEANKTPVDPSAAVGVIAKVDTTSNNKVTFYAYDNTKALTAEQVQAALQAKLYDGDTIPTITAEILKAGKVTSAKNVQYTFDKTAKDGDPLKENSYEAPGKAYKVTVCGTDYYAEEGGEVIATGLGSKMTAIISAKKIAVATGDDVKAVEDGTAAAITVATADQVWVAAVTYVGNNVGTPAELDDIDVYAVAKKTAAVQLPPVKLSATSASVKFVQKDADIQLQIASSATDIKPGQALSLTVNGKQKVTGNWDANGRFTFSPEEGVPAKNLLIVVDDDADKTYTVKLDGATLSDGVDVKVGDTILVEEAGGASLLVADETKLSGYDKGTESYVTVTGDSYYTVNADDDADEDGVIELVKGYEVVAVKDTPAYAVALGLDKDGALDAEKTLAVSGGADTKYYVKAGTDVFVKAEATDTSLKAAGASPLVLAKESYVVGGNVLYKVALNGDITKTTVVSKVSLKTAEVDDHAAVDVTDDPEKFDFDITGATSSVKKPAVQLAWDEETKALLGDTTITMKSQDLDDSSITFTVKTEAKESIADTTLKGLLTVEDVSFNLTVTVKAKGAS